MTLATIMKLALRQLDEDPADVGEYDELFRQYANMGYQIAVSEYVKPKQTLTLRTDGKGRTNVEGMNIVRVIALRDRDGREVASELSGDGAQLITARRQETLSALCEVGFEPLEDDMEEPALSDTGCMALVDYICYRHLMNGNMAKQSRAQAYQSSFYQAMRMLRPQGSGSVTGFRNLYAVSDARFTRW